MIIDRLAGGLHMLHLIMGDPLDSVHRRHHHHRHRHRHRHRHTSNNLQQFQDVIVFIC